MELVAFVAVLALLQYMTFVWQAGAARGRYDVAAPATVGHPDFERRYRVQMNSVEQLVLFLPGIWLFAHYVSPAGAAGLGGVFIVGRALYAHAYVRNPASRGPGFGLTVLSNMALVAGGGIGAVIHWL